MNSNIRIVNGKAISNLLSHLRDGEIGYLDREDFEMTCTEIMPPPGFKPKKGYPDCCDFHRSVKSDAEKLISDFPNCCEYHSRLAAASWFDKQNYTGVPDHILKSLEYSEFHVANALDNEDWYADITEYVEYAIWSFGQLPHGYGAPVGLDRYTNALKLRLGSWKKDSKDMEQRLDDILVFLETLGTSNEKASTTDLNILIDNYRRWLKAFPFEISYLSHLKSDYEHKIMILAEPPKTNRYLRTAKARMMSYKEQFRALLRITSSLLSEFNGKKLYDEGKLDEPRYQQLEVINAARGIEIDELKSEDNDDRKQYLKVIKKWLKGEKKYFKEIGEILQHSTRKQMFQN